MACPACHRTAPEPAPAMGSARAAPVILRPAAAPQPADPAAPWPAGNFSRHPQHLTLPAPAHAHPTLLLACPNPVPGCPERTPPLKFSLRRARMTGALTAILAMAALAGTAPAQAHDALASTSPAEGQTITTNPGKVSVTLNNPPETGVPGSNIIKVIAP